MKLVTVVVTSFVVCLGLYELVIRRIGIMRIIFGMHAGFDGQRRASPAPSAGA